MKHWALSLALLAAGCSPAPYENLKSATLVYGVGIEGEAVLGETTLADFVTRKGVDNIELEIAEDRFMFMPTYFGKGLKFVFPATKACHESIKMVNPSDIAPAFLNSQTETFFTSYPDCAHSRLQRIEASRNGDFTGRTDTGIVLGDELGDVNAKDPELKTGAAMAGDAEIMAIESRMPRQLLEKRNMTIQMIAPDLQRNGPEEFKLVADNISIYSDKPWDFFFNPPTGTNASETVTP